VFSDIHHINPNLIFEDWYVHPDLVDMNYISHLIENNKTNYINNNVNHTIISTINWQNINYNV
jgi:hypothetical protein